MCDDSRVHVSCVMTLEYRCPRWWHWAACVPSQQCCGFRWHCVGQVTTPCVTCVKETSACRVVITRPWQSGRGSTGPDGCVVSFRVLQVAAAASGAHYSLQLPHQFIFTEGPMWPTRHCLIFSLPFWVLGSGIRDFAVWYVLSTV